MSSLVDTFVEITLKNPESNADFLKIKETLSRIGIASKKEKRLSQTCHILHKQGKYYIVHFLEMFMLDGKKSHFTEEDEGRRNTIASLLEEWELLTIVNPSAIEYPRASMRRICIVPFKEKKDWIFESKYNIGTK